MSTDRLTEILNYLSAMSRDMGEFRQEVKTRLDRVETRLDGVEKRLDGVEKRLDAIDTRLDAVETRLDAIETRLDAVEKRLDGMETRLDGMETRLSGVEKRFDHFEMAVRSRFDDMISDIRRLDHKFESVQEDSTELRIGQRDQRERIENLERKQA